MGQKVNPHGLRVGVIKDWNSKWYANKADFADNLVEDNKIRDFVKKELYATGAALGIIVFVILAAISYAQMKLSGQFEEVK